MKLRSFRLRIALLSATLAGSALIGFAAISLWLIYDAKVSSLDTKLENQLMRSLRLRDEERWQIFQTMLLQDMGVSDEADAMVWILDVNGNTLYRSATWAADLKIETLLRTLPRHTQPLPLPAAPMPPPESDMPRPRRQEFHRAESIPGRLLPTPLSITQVTPSGSWRIAAIAFFDRQVAIAVNLQGIDQEMATIHNIFLVAIPAVLVLVAGGAWGLSGSALYPVQRLTDAIANVTIKGLDQRVPAASTDIELVQLIQVFNQMLERLERSFKQASRFSADAAHELKTPLAILQGELERTLQEVDAGSPFQQRLSHLLDEVRRLSEIVRKLLLLSLADAGQMRLQVAAVNLSALLTEMAEDLELLAPHLSVQTSIAEGLWVNGDHDLLTQVLHNLLSNAMKYNLPHGWIRIQAERQETQVKVTLSNASNDIPESDRDRIFDRFHRADPARSRKVEGTGLGLNLAWEIVRAHSGTLYLDPTPSGQTSFTLSLPMRVT